MKALVAVVSEDSEFLDRTSLVLEKSGYLVVPFLDSRKALQAFESIKFDILITAVVLGSSNGFVFAEQAHKLCPDLQVLLASRLAQKAASLFSGSPAFLNYAFTAENFARQVNALLPVSDRTRDTLDDVRCYLQERSLR
jgi:DNA-binding response OmpR family regulator